MAATVAAAVASAEAEVIELTEALVRGAAAAAEGRKEKGGSTGPVLVAEALGAATLERPEITAVVQAPSSVHTPATPPVNVRLPVSKQSEKRMRRNVPGVSSSVHHCAVQRCPL